MGGCLRFTPAGNNLRGFREVSRVLPLKNLWNGRSWKPLSLLRAQLYTTQRLVHCVLRRLLAGGL